MARVEAKPSQLFQAGHFALLGIYESEHATSLARHLMDAEIMPSCALVSAATDEQLAVSRPFWQEAQWWRRPAEILETHSELARHDGPSAVTTAYQAGRIPYLFIPGFGGSVTENLLTSLDPDAIVLAESPVLSGKILETYQDRMINLHAAPLPGYRGNRATWWALYHDEPLWASAHLVRRSVDQGPILGTAAIPVHRGDTLADIDGRARRVCGQLLVEVLRRAKQGIAPRPQQAWEGRTFRGEMPGDIHAELERRLQAGEYSHYV